MTRIELPIKATHNLIEGLNSLEEKTIHNSNLFIPYNLSVNGFGVLPSMILFLFKWLRVSESGNLVIDIDENDPEKAKLFVSNFLGYAMLISAWKHKEICNNQGVSLKQLFRPHTQDLRRKIDYLQNLPNDNLLIPLFDHYSKEQGLSHWFYDDSYKFASSPTALGNTVYRIFENLGRIYRTRLNKNVNDIIEDIEIILWELLKNTQEHATKDYLNEIELSPNIRAAFFKIHRASKRNFIKDAKGFSGLSNYFDSLLTEGENFVLEISVFDSGPGMVKRFLGRDWNANIDANEEVSIIKKCLCKGLTSAEGFRGSTKGYGLNNVLNTLSKQKGFLKIRTERVSLYRDLFKTPHFENLDYSRIELQDVKTNSPSKFTSTAFFIGTQITFFYPLR